MNFCRQCSPTVPTEPACRWFVALVTFVMTDAVSADMNQLLESNCHRLIRSKHWEFCTRRQLVGLDWTSVSSSGDRSIKICANYYYMCHVFGERMCQPKKVSRSSVRSKSTGNGDQSLDSALQDKSLENQTSGIFRNHTYIWDKPCPKNLNFDFVRATFSNFIKS